jgi:alkanesulfonate monooxygenase SsuD/methylene tetrahydromethanopterin reductase-like flavin-dependent oxidoreductase (luciferase family)
VKYLKASSAYQTHPSPQKKPVVFQARTSKMVRAFRSKNAEAIYVGGRTPSQIAGSLAQTRANAVAQGRDPQPIKFCGNYPNSWEDFERGAN